VLTERIGAENRDKDRLIVEGIETALSLIIFTQVRGLENTKTMRREKRRRLVFVFTAEAWQTLGPS